MSARPLGGLSLTDNRTWIRLDRRYYITVIWIPTTRPLGLLWRNFKFGEQIFIHDQDVKSQHTVAPVSNAQDHGYSKLERSIGSRFARGGRK
jgi:hypothetical protein